MRPEAMGGQRVVRVTPRCPLWVQTHGPAWAGCQPPLLCTGWPSFPRPPSGPRAFLRLWNSLGVPHEILFLVGNPFSRSGGGEKGGPDLIPGSPWGCEVL